MGPEFPSLPLKDFASIQRFAERSQMALVFVGSSGALSSGKFVTLPRISPYRLQLRFNFCDNSLLIINRKSYVLLKRLFDSFDVQRYQGLYVRGPVGVGKSYLLYLLAAECRLNRLLFRVTYINDCSLWRGDPFVHLLTELVTTFYDDVIEGKSIVKWCQEIDGSVTEDKMMRDLMRKLVLYVERKNIQWVLIFDQYDALFNPSVIKQYPFTIIETLGGGNNLKVVISASANNEGYPTEMKDWLAHDISSHRFDAEEFKVWCENQCLEGVGYVDPESEEASDALFWTGGVPYEVCLLWKQPANSLSQKTSLYRRERLVEFARYHKKFQDSLRDPDQDQQNLKLCVSRMTLGVSPPDILNGTDRQLFDIEANSYGESVITALNPIARAALIASHCQTLLPSLQIVAGVLFSEERYTNDIKGRIIEKYITTTLEVSNMFSFKPRKTTKTGLSTVDVALKKLHIKNVVHFSGNKTPAVASFNRNSTTLFIPESANYPGFDFFTWDAEQRVLEGFQVAVKYPFTSHPKIKRNSENCSEWLKFCFPAEDKSLEEGLKVYWIIPSDCVGKPKQFQDRVVLFEELYDNFPALRQLKLVRN